MQRKLLPEAAQQAAAEPRQQVDSWACRGLDEDANLCMGGTQLHLLLLSPPPPPLLLLLLLPLTLLLLLQPPLVGLLGELPLAANTCCLDEEDVEQALALAGPAHLHAHDESLETASC